MQPVSGRNGPTLVCWPQAGVGDGGLTAKLYAPPARLVVLRADSVTLSEFKELLIVTAIKINFLLLETAKYECPRMIRSMNEKNLNTQGKELVSRSAQARV